MAVSLKSTVSGVVVSVDESTAKNLGPEWVENAPASKPKKAAKSD